MINIILIFLFILFNRFNIAILIYLLTAEEKILSIPLNKNNEGIIILCAFNE